MSQINTSGLMTAILQAALGSSSSQASAVSSQPVFPGFGSYTGSASASSTASLSSDSSWMNLALSLLSLLTKGTEVSASGVSTTPIIASATPAATASAVSTAPVIATTTAAAAAPTVEVTKAAPVVEAKTVQKVEVAKPRLDTVTLSPTLKGTLPADFDYDNPATTALYGPRTYKLAGKEVKNGQTVIHYVYESGPIKNSKSRNLYVHVDGVAANQAPSSGSSYSGSSGGVSRGYTITSPLVFDLDGDGKTSTTSQTRHFDIDNDGQLDKINLVGAKDGLLVMDADGDGKVGENATEVFGNHTANGKFANGFEALKVVAQKQLGDAAIADGKLDASEIKALESKVKLSMQVNGEEKSLSKLGISNINLNYNPEHIGIDENGNLQGESSAFTQGGKDKTIVDVWFKKH